MEKLGSNTTGANVIAGAEITVAIIAFGVLARRVLHVERPIVPFDLLRITMFRVSVIGAFVGYMPQLIVLPFHLDGLMRRS